MLSDELLLARPVSGHPAPGKQSGGGQEEYAAAYGGDAASGGPRGGDPTCQRRIVPGSVDSAAAGHHQRVDPGRVQISHTVGSVYRNTAAGRHRARQRRRDLAGVSAGEVVGVLENLVRAEEVQRLETLEDDEDDAALLHPSTLGSDTEGVNDTYPTLRAMPASATSGSEASIAPCSPMPHSGQPTIRIPHTPRGGSNIPTSSGTSRK